MDDGLLPQMRDPRYAPRRLDIERRDDGTVILFNPTPFSTAFDTVNAALDHWAVAAPARVWPISNSCSSIRPRWLSAPTRCR